MSYLNRSRATGSTLLPEDSLPGTVLRTLILQINTGNRQRSDMLALTGSPPGIPHEGRRSL
ncbi:Uncharacterised protein [Mycobacteroides abscessus subsp. abscessus]|nr:Uncharacterised protein [Mycobacteroides abscessus subsp. abscessus]